MSEEQLRRVVHRDPYLDTLSFATIISLALFLVWVIATSGVL